MARAKDAHDAVMSAVYRAQADALLIESRAKARLADEYEAAQERGEVGRHGDPRRFKVDGDNDGRPATAADLGLRRDQIQEARRIRDAEAAEPGLTERTLERLIEAGDGPARAELAVSYDPDEAQRLEASEAAVTWLENAGAVGSARREARRRRR